jgi:hypothetical protein
MKATGRMADKRHKGARSTPKIRITRKWAHRRSLAADTRRALSKLAEQGSGAMTARTSTHYGPLGITLAAASRQPIRIA